MKKVSSKRIRDGASLRKLSGEDKPSEDVQSGALSETERSVEYLESFNKLVTCISSDFAKAPPSEIDGLVEGALRTIGEFSKVDRSYVLQIYEYEQVLSATHEWCAEGISSRLGNRQEIRFREKLPWLSALAYAAEPVVIQDVAKLPPEARAEMALFQEEGVGCLILVPMLSAGNLIGYLGCECLDAPRVWDEDTTALLRIVGQILLGAMSIKLHQEAVDRERSLMDALMDNIPDRVYFKDSESHFIRISKAQAGLFGLDHPEQAIGKTDFDFFTEVHAQQAYEDEQQIIKTGEPMVSQVERETWSDRPESWVSTTKMPLSNAEEKIVGTFGISRDVTEHKLMEEALEEHATLLERTNAELKARNQDLDEFAYVASHDLKAPLRAIHNLADWIDEDSGDVLPSESKTHLKQMRQRVSRLEKLLDDLLQYSRVGRVEHEAQECDARETVENIVEILDLPDAFSVEVNSELPTVKTARVPFDKVMRNLISNAVAHHDRTDGHIRVSAREAGDFFEFTVEDDGPGIPLEFHERVFKMFQTLKPRDEKEGSGMGLALVRKTVEVMGGTILVESPLRDDRGCAVRFSWPTYG
jgi:PAS domain S-box-containing protein